MLELVSTPSSCGGFVVHVGPQLGGDQHHDVTLIGAMIRSTLLGAVGLVGPPRMDYEKAIRMTRAAAFESSRFVEDVYDEEQADVATTERDYYEVLGVERGASDAQIKKAF